MTFFGRSLLKRIEKVVLNRLSASKIIRQGEGHVIKFIFILECEERQSLDRGIEIEEENVAAFFPLNDTCEARRQHCFSNPTFPTTERDCFHHTFLQHNAPRTLSSYYVLGGGNKGVL
jgi:hypothetical protein